MSAAALAAVAADRAAVHEHWFGGLVAVGAHRGRQCSSALSQLAHKPGHDHRAAGGDGQSRAVAQGLGEQAPVGNLGGGLFDRLDDLLLLEEPDGVGQDRDDLCVELVQAAVAASLEPAQLTHRPPVAVSDHDAALSAAVAADLFVGPAPTSRAQHALAVAGAGVAGLAPPAAITGRVDSGNGLGARVDQRLGEAIQDRQQAGGADAEHVGMLVDIDGQAPQGPAGGDRLGQHPGHRVGVKGSVGGGHALDNQTPPVLVDDPVAIAVPAPLAPRSALPIPAGDTAVFAAGSTDGAVFDGLAVRTDLVSAAPGSPGGRIARQTGPVTAW